MFHGHFAPPQTVDTSPLSFLPHSLSHAPTRMDAVAGVLVLAAAHRYCMQVLISPTGARSCCVTVMDIGLLTVPMYHFCRFLHKYPEDPSEVPGGFLSDINLVCIVYI